MSIVPVSIGAGVSGVSGRRIPINAWDQAIAGLSTTPDILLNAWTGQASVAGAPPADRVDGVGMTFHFGMTAVLNDPDFGHTSFNAGAAAGAHIRSPNRGTPIPQSYSFGFVFRPLDVQPAQFFGLGTAPYGARVQLNATELRLESNLVSGLRLTLPKSVLNFGANNVLIVSIDHVSRQIAGWVNSINPAIATGVDNQFPVPILQNYFNFGAGGASGSDGCNAKFASGFGASQPLFRTVGGRMRARRLVEAAATAYGVALT